jgi:hypothetical protein
VLNPYRVVMNQTEAMNINNNLSQKLPLAKNDRYNPVGAPRNKTTTTYNLPDHLCMAFDFFRIYLENWISAVSMQTEPANM